MQRGRQADDINSTKQLECIWEYPTKLSMKLWAWRQAKEGYYIQYLRHETTGNTLGMKEKLHLIYEKVNLDEITEENGLKDQKAEIWMDIHN